MARLDPDKMVAVVADVLAFGLDRAAARHGVTTRTVRRYREKVEADPALSARVDAKKRQLEQVKDEERIDWVRAASRAAVQALQTGEELCQRIRQEKDVDRLRDVAGWTKLVLEPLITHQALNGDVDDSGPDFPSPAAEEHPGQAAGGAGSSAASPPAVH